MCPLVWSSFGTRSCHYSTRGRLKLQTIHQQAASRKSALPYYYPAPVVNYSQLSDQVQSLAQFRDHHRITAYMWQVPVGCQTLAYFRDHP